MAAMRISPTQLNISNPFTSNCSSDGSRRPASTVVLFENLPGSSKRCVHCTASAAQPVCLRLQSTCYDALADEATPATVRGWDSHPTTTAEQHGVRAQ
jgi:hypothetical protein